MKFAIGDKVTIVSGDYADMAGVVDSVDDWSLWPYGVVFEYDDIGPGESGKIYELFQEHLLAPAYRVDAGPRHMG